MHRPRGGFLALERTTEHLPPAGVFYKQISSAFADIGAPVPAGRRRRAIAPQRSCVDSADCDSEGDESSPGPAPAAPARADHASGEHRCCDKKLPIPYSSDIEAFPDFEPGKQYPVRSAPRPPIPATVARATTSAQYQWVGSQPQHSKLVKPAPKLGMNRFLYRRYQPPRSFGIPCQFPKDPQTSFTAQAIRM